LWRSSCRPHPALTTTTIALVHAAVAAVAAVLAARHFHDHKASLKMAVTEFNSKTDNFRRAKRGCVGLGATRDSAERRGQSSLLVWYSNCELALGPVSVFQGVRDVPRTRFI
jgi:hypothetical protein